MIKVIICNMNILHLHFPFTLALIPDQPTNLAVTNIKSRSAEISWIDPVNTGEGDLTRFRIKLKKNNFLIQNITTNKVNQYTLSNLIPCTKHEITVAAGNKHGFGEETITSFLTSEEGENKIKHALKKAINTLIRFVSY